MEGELCCLHQEAGEEPAAARQARPVPAPGGPGGVHHRPDVPAQVGLLPGDCRSHSHTRQDAVFMC